MICFFLAERSPDQDIRHDAFASLRHHLFYQVNEEGLRRYAQKAPWGQQLLLTEAMCSRYVRSGRRREAQQLFQRFRARGGQASAYMQRLIYPRSQPHYYEPRVIKLALALPLHLKHAQKGGAVRQMVHDFYEGFRQAAKDYAPYSRKKILLKVLDSREETAVLAAQLQRLGSFYPDMVIGDMYNVASEQIAAWCHQRGIPQVVPLQPYHGA